MSTSALLDLVFLTRRRDRFPFVKSTDAWVTVLAIDLFAIPLVLLLAQKPFRDRVHPDHLTMFAFLMFFIGLVLLLAGAAPIVAIVCFLVSIVMDCADGKLARHLHLQTPHGAIVDAAVDLLLHGPGFVVIAVWAYGRHHSIIALAVSVLMAVYFSYTHLTSILRDTGVMERIVSIEVTPQPPSRWQRFCEKRGLELSPFGPVEICFLVFPVLFVWLPSEPVLPLAAAVLLLVQKATSKRTVVRR